MKKLIGSLVALPLLTAGVVVGGSAAQAADIVLPVPGPFANVYAIASPPGAVNGVNVEIIGGTAFFKFIPPPTGLNYSTSLATGAFTQFGLLPTPGIIQDFDLPFPLGGIPGVTVTAKNIPNFLNLDGVAGPDSVFNLTGVTTPQFTTSPVSTSVSFGFLGDFVQTPPGGVPGTYKGSGTISATFIGLTPANIIALAMRPGQGITTSWSGTFTLVTSVPEPSSVAGLIVFAGVSTMLLKRRQKG